MPTKEYLTLKYDVVFKNVFYRDSELLKDFISSILNNFYDIQIDKIEIKNAELTKNRVYIKNKTIDILVIANNKVINMELNNNRYSKTTKLRNLSYLFSAYVEDIHTSKTYQTGKEYLQINFNFQGKNKRGFSSYYLREDNNLNDILVNNIRIININVDYFLDKWYNSSNKEEYLKKYKYIILIGMSKEELRKIKGDDKMLKRVRNDIEKLNQSEDFYQLFTDEEDLEYYGNGLYSEGMEHQNTVIASNLKKEKVSFDIINKVTGLSIPEIKSLK